MHSIELKIKLILKKQRETQSYELTSKNMNNTHRRWSELTEERSELEERDSDPEPLSVSEPDEELEPVRESALEPLSEYEADDWLELRRRRFDSGSRRERSPPRPLEVPPRGASLE